MAGIFTTTYDRVHVRKADTRRLCVESVLTFPTHDLAGDWVVPEGLDFSLHEQDPSIDLEHARTHIKGYPVAWARESLGKPGAPYAVEMVPLNCAGPGEPEEWHTLPVGTSYFDPSDRIGSQTFALVEQGALPAVSLEFQTVPGAYREIGWSDLERRKSLHFDKARVLKWTLCAVPVNPGALHVAKSVGLVPLSIAQVLIDGRVNVGGRWEPLHPVIRKALAATGTAAAPRTTTVRVEKAAMEPDDEFDGNLGDDMGGDLDTQDDALFADAVDDEPMHAGVQALYSLADALKDRCEEAKQAAKATENPEIYRVLMKLCDKVESLADEAEGHGDKHDQKLMAMKNGSDAGEGDEEPDSDEGEEPEAPADGDGDEMPAESADDEGDDEKGEKKPPFKKARRAVYLKAMPKQFNKADVDAGKSKKKKAVDDAFAAAKRVFK